MPKLNKTTIMNHSKFKLIYKDFVTSSALKPPMRRESVVWQLGTVLDHVPPEHSMISPSEGRKPSAHSRMHRLPSTRSRLRCHWRIQGGGQLRRPVCSPPLNETEDSTHYFTDNMGLSQNAHNNWHVLFETFPGFRACLILCYYTIAEKYHPPPPPPNQILIKPFPIAEYLPIHRVSRLHTNSLKRQEYRQVKFLRRNH